MTSNQTSRKRDRDDDRVEFEYIHTGQTPINVTHVRFHSSVTKVDSDACFNECDKLKDIVFNDGLEEIRQGAFCHCSALESITFPSTLVEIGKISFSSCSSLKELVLNEGLKHIGTKAFHHCSSLQSITLPSTLIDTGITVFAYCINLKQVVLKEGLQTINGCAFYGCESLERISLPSSLTKISLESFWGCNNLRVVELHGIVQKIGEDAFANCQSLEKFTFPPFSTRLENIIQVGYWLEVEGKIDEIGGVVVERRGSEIFVSAADMRRGNNWDTIKHVIDRINEVITYYEKKEATTLFELALWKANLDRASDMTREACRTRGKYRSTRGKHRIEVPGPVKDAILQYLG